MVQPFNKNYPPMNWPIEQIYQQLDEALVQQGQCIIVAPPGAGKSTLLPLHLLQQIKEGLIILVEPRRVAARAVARRMASLLGEEVGHTIGYAMRLEHKQSHQTRILVVTEGVFSHRLLDDPELNGVAAVLFDEFHERSLDADFGLALALDVRTALRPDLQLIVMSATLDAARVAKLMGDAPLIEAQGRQFDVDIHYQPLVADEPLEQAMTRTILQTLAQMRGNILAFLPGQKEIEHTLFLLEKRLGSDIVIAPLYGSLSAQAQDIAIRAPQAGQRKIVLATSIAQTSLTIEGVRIVIDSGLARQPVYEPNRGLTRLETVLASQADIAQRAGRAGRLEPGIAIRLWHEGQTLARPNFAPPEILSADLSALLLNCAAFGVRDPSQLRFLDPPPRAAYLAAQQWLMRFGALDTEGRLTATGNTMRYLALPVRYAYMIAKAPSPKSAQLALLLSERGLGGTDIDIENRYRTFCRDKGGRSQKIRQLAAKMVAKITQEAKQEEQSLGSLLLHAWPDRVARTKTTYGQFLLANGRAAHIDPSHHLAKQDWLVVADLAGKASHAKILAAIEIDEETIHRQLASHVERTTLTNFDPKTGTIRHVEQAKLGAIALKSHPLPAITGEEANQAWLKALCQYGTDILPWDKNSLSLRQRLQWLHQTLGDPWPEITEESLIGQLPDFLPGRADLKGAGNFLETALIALVPYQLQRQIDILAPKYFIAPTGTNIALDYQKETPILRIKVQELFGINHHPTIADGQVKLVIELLSPAARPIQITCDLPAFWHGSWSAVRSEMRGRYPKHAWPEDPATAVPTRRAKPRST